jgi:ABC-type multidrug transport system permease subunit
VRLYRFLAILGPRNKEFWRDRAALGLVEGAAQQELAFLDTKYVQFVTVADVDKAVVKVERHQLDMLLDPQDRRYWVNDSSPAGYVLERLLQGGDQGLSKQLVTGDEIRYVDWLISGILAMNLMFSALFGVGFVIVRYRKNGVLKRLRATPLTAFEFLAAQVVSRLWLLIAVSMLVFVGTDLFLDYRMYGSYLDLLIVFILGAICLISLGLLFAARIASEELAGGLLNLISWPMMFLSGVWFSLEGVNPWIQKLALLLPLTHVIDGARAIMIDGAGLLDIAPNLIVLLGMTALFLALGSWLFRWE